MAHTSMSSGSIFCRGWHERYFGVSCFGWLPLLLRFKGTPRGKKAAISGLSPTKKTGAYSVEPHGFGP